MSIVYFLLLVGVLVLIHELGHFAAAKLLDVKVLRLSIGYGRPLVRLRLGETEYQLALFPLGGYVRILGVEGEASNQSGSMPVPGKQDVGRSFASRPLWQRLAIVLAGPAANLALPVVVYFGMFAGQTMLPAAVIGDVREGGTAARAGLEAGDRVLEIDGHAVRYWEDIEATVQSSPGKELHLRISRNGKVFERYVTPLEQRVWSKERDGRMSTRGWIDISHVPSVPLIGVIDAQSPAARAGLRTGDLIISIDGQPVRNWSDVQHHLGRLAHRASIVYFRGAELSGTPQVRLLSPGFADLVPATELDAAQGRQTYTGLERAEMFVARVDPGSPADSAGLKPGDLIVAVDGKQVVHWLDLDQRLQADPKKAFKLTWKRAGPGGKTETLDAELTQVWRNELDDYGHTARRLVFGAHDDIDRGTGAMVPNEARFGYALAKAFDLTGETISTMVTGFVQIFGWGGPLSMYKVASESGRQGWYSFLRMLALISINLGLINLLPIPMLDGGHLLVFAIEGARRRKLSQRTRERIQLAGLIVIALITILALRNDVIRYLL